MIIPAWNAQQHLNLNTHQLLNLNAQHWNLNVQCSNSAQHSRFESPAPKFECPVLKLSPAFKIWMPNTQICLPSSAQTQHSKFAEHVRRGLPAVVAARQHSNKTSDGDWAGCFSTCHCFKPLIQLEVALPNTKQWFVHVMCYGDLSEFWEIEMLMLRFDRCVLLSASGGCYYALLQGTSCKIRSTVAIVTHSIHLSTSWVTYKNSKA